MTLSVYEVQFGSYTFINNNIWPSLGQFEHPTYLALELVEEQVSYDSLVIISLKTFAKTLKKKIVLGFSREQNQWRVEKLFRDNLTLIKNTSQKIESIFGFICEEYEAWDLEKFEHGGRNRQHLVLW